MMLKRFCHHLFCKMIFSCFKVKSFKTNIKNTLNCFLIGLLTQTHSISTVTVTHLYTHRRGGSLKQWSADGLVVSA